MDNPVKLLVSTIYKLFVVELGDGNLPIQATSAIRLHTDKLNHSGDLSVGNEDGWRRILSTDAPSALATAIYENSNEVTKLNDACRALVEATAKCIFPLADFKLNNGHGIAFLQRNKVTHEIMQMVICNEANYGTLCKKSNQRVLLLPLADEANNEQLTSHRVVLVHKVLQKLLQHSSWTLVAAAGEDEQKLVKVQVTSVTTQQIPNDDCVHIKCGVVTEPITKKVTTLSVEEYNALRANDVYLMARHKYGIRSKLNERFKTLIAGLGESAATVDLLEVKHTSPVHIIRNGTGSTRGAAFILYNSARLETLLRTFEQRVEAKILPPLPAVQEIDFTLLKEEVKT